jgi:hypothetical protein
MDYSHIELEIPRACIEDCSGPGDASDAVTYWLKRPEIATQFDGLTLLDTARMLYGYGAWEAEELADRDTNIQRLLWLACGQLYDDPNEAFHEGRTAYAYLEGRGYTEELASLT